LKIATAERWIKQIALAAIHSPAIIGNVNNPLVPNFLAVVKIKVAVAPLSIVQAQYAAEEFVIIQKIKRCKN
jgi:hypothetical protein